MLVHVHVVLNCVCLYHYHYYYYYFIRYYFQVLNRTINFEVCESVSKILLRESTFFVFFFFNFIS